MTEPDFDVARGELFHAGFVLGIAAAEYVNNLKPGSTAGEGRGQKLGDFVDERLADDNTREVFRLLVAYQTWKARNP